MITAGHIRTGGLPRGTKGRGHQGRSVRLATDALGQPNPIERFDVIDLIEQLGDAPPPEEVLVDRDVSYGGVAHVLARACHVERVDAVGVDLAGRGRHK